jgi:carbon-monoxide dehydrogenase medium subunit
VKPAKFEYHSPVSVDEALRILERYQGEARVLAGGQSLVPMMNFRLATPAAIVDLNRVAGLAGIGETDGAVSIGAMARQRQIEFAPLIAEKLPLLGAAMRWIGHLPTRTRGTIGGSIAHADPAAEIPMILQTLAGEVVRFPPMATEASYAIEEFARRKGDFAIAAIAVMLMRDGERCTMARLATAGIGPVTVRLRNAEAILEERGLGEASVAAAADKAAELVEPMSDQHGSADFRRHLTGVLTRRAVQKAIRERAHAGTG